MKQTPYFQNRVLKQRPYIKLEWVDAGEVIGIEIEHATQRIDLRDFHLSAIPTSAAPSAP